MRRFVAALVKHETNTFSPVPTPLASFGHGEGPALGDAARARFEGTNTPMAAYLDIARRENADVVTPIAAESWPSGKATRATFEELVRPIEDAVRAGCDAVLLDLHGAMVIDDCDDAEGEIVQRLRRIAPEVPIAVTLDYHTNLSHVLVDNATVITGLQDLSARGHVRSGHARGRHPRRRARRRDRARDGVGLEAAPCVDHAARARRRSLRRHRALRQANGSRRQRARRDAVPVVSACGYPVHGRIGGRGRRRAARRPRARAGGVHAHAEDGVGPSRRIRLPAGPAGGVGGACEGAWTRQPGRARAAHRPLRQLRIRRRAGRDGRRRRSAAPGARGHCDRAHPRPGRGREDDRRRGRPARQAGARRPHRHAVDRIARCAADGRRPRAGDHRRRVRRHRPHVHGRTHAPRAHRGPRHRPRADRRHRAPARAFRSRRVHARWHRSCQQALCDAQVAHPLPGGVQADRLAHRRMHGRGRHQRGPVGVSVPQAHPPDLSARSRCNIAPP